MGLFANNTIITNKNIVTYFSIGMDDHVTTKDKIFAYNYIPFY